MLTYLYILIFLLFLLALYGLIRWLCARRQQDTEVTMELKEAERIKELDAVKTKLYTYITHEFRTPLTVILGMAEQIAHDPDRWLGSGVSAIDRNARQLLRLVNQMLNLAKLESGNLELHMVTGDIIHYLHYVLESFQSFAESKKIRLHFLTKPGTFTMDFDPDHLLNVISNLLSNAIKFTPEDGDVYLSVQIQRSETANAPEILALEIRDTGIGIPEDKLPYIFDRFYQVALTDQLNTTGIGLSLTKELVKLMNGTIQVASRPDEGTTFTIRLPVYHTATETLSETAYELKVDKALKPAPVSHDKKIEEIDGQADLPLALIVEDNPDVLHYIASCLEKNYRLAFAENGQSGIDKAIEYVPDIIVSDVMMPEKNGFEVCETLKNDQRTSHIPIILLTAKADIHSRLKGLRRGADAYLSKPFNKEELLIRMQTQLELRRKLRRHYLALAADEQIPTLPGERPAEEAAEHAFVQQVRQVIEAHLSDHELTVEDLCREMAMSSSQMHRKLKALTGQSTNKLIRSIRLNKAKELLLDPELTVASVAYDCGFKDHAYFHRVFKKTFGKTPTEFRENA